VFVWKFLPETKSLAVEDIVKLFEPLRQPPAPGGDTTPDFTSRLDGVAGGKSREANRIQRPGRA
jgi:hypothetical protein